jgi:hypothetical protein
MCSPKEASGRVDVPDDIFQKRKNGGKDRDKLLEIFSSTGFNKEWSFTRTNAIGYPMFSLHKCVPTSHDICVRVTICSLNGWLANGSQ